MKISKELKKSGKATFKGPKVKDRKKFAPPTKVQNSKKTYNRDKKTLDEDEEHPTVSLKSISPKKESDKFQPRKPAKEVGKNPSRRTAKQIRGEEDEEKSCWKGYEKKGMKKKGDKKVPNCVPVNESKLISNFVDNIIMKNYAQADKYLKEVVELKIAQRLAKEVNTPLFDK